MVGFGTSKDDEFGVKNAQPGEWYSYGLYDGSYRHGRFAKFDDLVYFNQGIAEVHNETGSEWVLKEGEIAVPPQSLTTFYRSGIDEVKHVLAIRNWYRQYLGEWVAIEHPRMIAVGKATKVFQTAFHLKPYVAAFGERRLVEDGKEKVAFFSNPLNIEILTEVAVKEYLQQKEKATSEEA